MSYLAILYWTYESRVCLRFAFITVLSLIWFDWCRAELFLSDCIVFDILFICLAPVYCGYSSQKG